MRARLLASFISMVLVSAACGGAGTTTTGAVQGVPASEVPLGPVTIFTGLDTGYAPLYVAELQGMFASNGVTVTVQTFTSGAEAVTAVRSAKAGYVLGGDLPSLNAWSVGGGDIVGIAPVAW